MKKILTIAIMASLLSNCAPTTNKPEPDLAIPQNWSAQSVTGESVTAEWWNNFKNPELDEFMSAALSGNTDIAVALRRIDEARANLRIAGASLLPSVDASAGGSLARNKPVTGKSTTTRRLDTGLDISYELDLFGGNRAAIESANQSYKKSAYDADALALVTMAETAKSYATLLALRDRIAIADESLNNANEILRIVNARYKAGMGNAIDVARQETSLGNARATLRALLEDEAKAQNALAILIGRLPQDLTVDTISIIDLAVPAIAATQPSALLSRRPDIAAAEAALKAANADIDAARAAFYPTLTLGSGFGIVKSPLGDPAATALNLAASLAAPIFSGGRLEGGLEAATARQAQLLETYRGTVLSAFQETEDALQSAASSSDRVNILAATSAEARKTYTLTRKRYEAGSIDLAEVIDAQDSLLATQNSLTAARLDRVYAAIDLYKAMGGGWQ